VAAYEREVLSQEKGFDVGVLPEHVIKALGSPWTSECRTKNGMLRRGRSLLPEPRAGLVGYPVECPEDLRSIERSKYFPRLITPEASKEWHFAFYVDLRPYVSMEAKLNVITTVFICFVLLMASMCINSDANGMVLKPVETMILQVNMIRINPLMATKIADDAFKKEEIAKAKAAQAKKSLRHRAYIRFFCQSEQVVQPMETIILEKTIIKLGTLLALGFGEAGANIIGQNMSGTDSSVNAMVPGLQVECLIGNARIRDFHTATEVLQVKVMAFVNQVAEIVHGLVDSFHGSANANNGETFLMVWPAVDVDASKRRKRADMAVMALIRIFCAVHRSAVLAQYRVHPGLQQKRVPRVGLTFGLHYGWAIEGAVGSEFKIDASYLSPNVNIAETVERATEVYNVNFMLTEAVIRMCSPAMAKKCRVVARVQVSGAKEHLNLYVVDLSCLFLAVEPPRPDFRWSTRQRFRCRQLLEADKMQKVAEEVQMANLFDTSFEVNTMRAPYTLEFMHVFNMGYENFSQGEWQVARRILRNTCTLLGFEDGPSATLLRFMEKQFDFECPEGWQGVYTLEPSGRLGPPVLNVAQMKVEKARKSFDEFDQLHAFLRDSAEAALDASGAQVMLSRLRPHLSGSEERDFVSDDVPMEEQPLAFRRWH